MYYLLTAATMSATAAAAGYFQPACKLNHRMQVRHLLCECGGGEGVVVGAHAHGLGGGPADEEEQDLAGMCFDPTGAFVYVASGKGVAEWRVRGAEQRWWTEPEWA